MDGSAWQSNNKHTVACCRLQNAFRALNHHVCHVCHRHGSGVLLHLDTVAATLADGGLHFIQLANFLKFLAVKLIAPLTLYDSSGGLYERIFNKFLNENIVTSFVIHLHTFLGCKLAEVCNTLERLLISL